MNASSKEALELCRTLLAFSAPGVAVTVPHAALAEVVELASGRREGDLANDDSGEPLQDLFDVAALARRYNRAATTVRQWFHDGLFGPPEERRFRGRGYVAPAEAVREFERRTGLKSVVARLGQAVEESGTAEPAIRVSPAWKRKGAPAPAGGFAAKIFPAQGGIRVRQPA